MHFITVTGIVSIRNKEDNMLKGKNILLIFSVLAIPLIIYFYFLKWKTNTIYGDDLYEYIEDSAPDKFLQIIGLLTNVDKFRPLHGLTAHSLIELFHKNLNYYYFFNVFIQTINAYILAIILNLFLRSAIISLFSSLLYALSRFSFYNISQLINGSEGLALTFFLLTLYFMTRAIRNFTFDKPQKRNDLLWATLTANASLYFHERYVVLFPCIVLIAIFFPGIKILSNRKRLSIIFIAAFSIFLNVAIKKYCYGISFFMGTDHTSMKFSFVSAIGFFTDAVLSIFQINSGPEFLIGIAFNSLNSVRKVVVFLLAGGVLVVSCKYLFETSKWFRQNDMRKRSFYIYLFLAILFVFCLVPAVVTVRLEQRWLQAPLIIFIVMTIVAINSLHFKNDNLKTISSVVFVFTFIWIDRCYLAKGIDNLYLKVAERRAGIFKTAINNGVINCFTTKLYIWENNNDANTNNEINWALAGGNNFQFYQGKSKKIFFIDSKSVIPTFNRDSAQVVFVRDSIEDITNEYFKDPIQFKR